MGLQDVDTELDPIDATTIQKEFSTTDIQTFRGHVETIRTEARMVSTQVMHSSARLVYTMIIDLFDNLSMYLNAGRAIDQNELAKLLFHLIYLAVKLAGKE